VAHKSSCKSKGPLAPWHGRLTHVPGLRSYPSTECSIRNPLTHGATCRFGQRIATWHDNVWICRLESLDEHATRGIARLDTRAPIDFAEKIAVSHLLIGEGEPALSKRPSGPIVTSPSSTSGPAAQRKHIREDGFVGRLVSWHAIQLELFDAGVAASRAVTVASDALRDGTACQDSGPIP
jgi:hypothetical protein